MNRHPSPSQSPAGPVRRWLGRPLTLRRIALAQLVGNVVIVITGGAVRLTGSGLGCPTWPQCTDKSYVVTRAMGYHGVIEFSNRSLTFVLSVLAVAAVAAALAQSPRVRRRVLWSVLAAMIIPGQAVLGGIVVLTHLNPWLVSGHFLLSIAVIAAAYQLWLAAGEPAGPGPVVVPAAMAILVRLLVGFTAAVLVVGAVVTGSGPHSGDSASPKRTGLNPDLVSQLHADLVMLVLGGSVALYFAARAIGAPRRLLTATAVLIGAELAEGAVGFVQHFTHLPVLLVGLHMAGSCAVWVAALAALAATREPAPARPPGQPV